MSLEKKYINIIFYISFSMILILQMFLSASSLKYINIISPLSNLKYLFLLFLIIRIFFISYKVKHFFLFIFIGSLLAVSYIKSGSTTLLISYILIISAKDIDFTKLLKVFISVLSVSSIFIILLSQANIIENLQIIRQDTGDLRYALGFGHPNTLGLVVLLVCMSWMYIRFDNLNFIDYISWALLALLIDQVVDSRTSLYMILLLLFLTIIFKMFGNVIMKFNISKLLLILMFPLFSLLSIWFTVQYDRTNPLFVLINQLVSGRIRLANYFYNEYGFSLFGQKITLIGTIESLYIPGASPQLLDNVYLQLIIRFGFISLLIFCGCYIFLINKCIKEKNIALIICIILMAIYGLTEVYPINVIYNFTLIAILSTTNLKQKFKLYRM